MANLNKKLLAAVLMGSMAFAGVSLAGEEEGLKRGPEMVLKFDVNKDGKLDDTERAAMRAEFQKMRAERIAKYDTNKDGKLDDAEREAAHKARAAERFKQLDTNGNGSLSLEEFKAGVAEREGHHGRYGGGHR